MKLKRVISGGQTGADRTALECAKALGLETGGKVPKGCRTDEGPAPDLVTTFGCVEDSSPNYPPRTAWNVRHSEATVWFGNSKSPGGWLTKSLCKDMDKTFWDNPVPSSMIHIAARYECINVAGNRKRTNPGVVAQVQAAFAALTQELP